MSLLLARSHATTRTEVGEQAGVWDATAQRNNVDRMCGTEKSHRPATLWGCTEAYPAALCLALMELCTGANHLHHSVSAIKPLIPTGREIERRAQEGRDIGHCRERRSRPIPSPYRANRVWVPSGKNSGKDCGNRKKVTLLCRKGKDPPMSSGSCHY